jgi:hydroxyacylglutathione hydrolase
MKRINKEGPPSLGAFTRPSRLAGSRPPAVLAEGAFVLDIRGAGETAAGFIPGTLTIAAGRSFTTWAGSLLPWGAVLYLLASSPDDAGRASRELALIGFDDVRGWFGTDALQELQAHTGALDSLTHVTPSDAAERFRRGEVALLDVRGHREYEAGHIPGALHIPLGSLPARIGELPPKPIAVHCATGARSAMAVSVLKRAGATDAVNMAGGFSAYAAAGLPAERTGATDAGTATGSPAGVSGALA